MYLFATNSIKLLEMLSLEEREKAIKLIYAREYEKFDTWRRVCGWKIDELNSAFHLDINTCLYIEKYANTTVIATERKQSHSIEQIIHRILCTSKELEILETDDYNKNKENNLMLRRIAAESTCILHLRFLKEIMKTFEEVVSASIFSPDEKYELNEIFRRRYKEELAGQQLFLGDFRVYCNIQDVILKDEFSLNCATIYNYFNKIPGTKEEDKELYKLLCFCQRYEAMSKNKTDFYNRYYIGRHQICWPDSFIKVLQITKNGVKALPVIIHLGQTAFLIVHHTSQTLFFCGSVDKVIDGWYSLVEKYHNNQDEFYSPISQVTKKKIM